MFGKMKPEEKEPKLSVLEELQNMLHGKMADKLKPKAVSVEMTAMKKPLPPGQEPDPLKDDAEDQKDGGVDEAAEGELPKLEDEQGLSDKITPEELQQLEELLKKAMG